MINIAREVQAQFKDFYLAGGTAVMVKYDHRQSLDLDFLKEKAFSFARLTTKVNKNFPVDRMEQGTDNIDFFIYDLKISFVFFPFKNVEKLQTVQEIIMASDYDLFLNKLYVAGRRVDPKDPFDAAFLYKTHHWDKARIKKDFELKYPGQSFEIFLGALLSFEDYEPLQPWIKTTLTELLP